MASATMHHSSNSRFILSRDNSRVLFLLSAISSTNITLLFCDILHLYKYASNSNNL